MKEFNKIIILAKAKGLDVENLEEYESTVEEKAKELGISTSDFLEKELKENPLTESKRQEIEGLLNKNKYNVGLTYQRRDITVKIVSFRHCTKEGFLYMHSNGVEYAEWEIEKYL